MTVSMLQLEFLMVIIVRMTAFIFTAPFFSMRNVPRRVKIGFAVFTSLILYTTLPYEPLNYNGVIDYAILVMQEALAGAFLGLVANLCYQILAFVGQFVDMQIGFSMVNEFDPITSSQVTITANLFSYAVMLVLFATYMHHYILQAFIDSFQVIPVGKAFVNPLIYQPMVQFITDYFVIGLRIALPVFASILIVDAILAILAKVAPQMNMFVVGLQLKVLVGLFAILVMINLLPGVADFIFNEMMDMMRAVLPFLG